MSLDLTAAADASAPPSRAAPPPLWLLALITFSGTLAMHIFVPALPQAAADLGASAGSMQLTVSFYILGLAVGQLVYGPISDHFGRRKVLIFGMILYAGAGFAALVAPTVHALIAARLFQALGGCAGLVLGRAIVRDSSGTANATQRLALMNLMVTLGPGIAPLIGTALASTAGWRSIFVALCLLGVANLLLTWRILPETSTGAGHDTRTVLRNYRQLLGSRAFLGYSVGGACATTSMYAFIGAAPFIFINQMHRPAREVGFYLAINIAGLWLGSLTASRLAGRMPINRLLVRGNVLSCLGAAAFLLCVVTGHLNVPLTVATMAIFTFGAGIASPAALAEAMSVNPFVAGSASGLYGFTQMAIGAICTSLAGLGSSPALAAALVLTIAGLLAQASFWIAARRAG
ncbi:MFS transporter, DHA1 family, bicyclomycin/chloramphenicol resistance protein [Faunimonas pinastri]|uniref:Bcr/CflA family efflux transporter n=1 Tax=Faunimonas pinastri TaxID=1855383 RepID=A0A1H9K9M6_9HYPH|nr:multidrug effflux MFS transporter [Faunimonas pinastri]SEQ95758.1 MFS transporter, DHA1 family, bicyclomycin/chloramphenicol resistance protein [Faunimonas pinastri]